MGKEKLNKYNSLDQLGKLLSDDERKEIKEKDEYQAKWRDNKYKFRQMVAKKNRKWLNANKENPQFEYYKEHPEVYDKIVSSFEDESKRKWMIHVLTNFMPLNVVRQVPKIPPNKHICPFTGYELTDTNSILTGDRDKHLAFTGKKTNVIISGIALQELERFVMDCIESFDSRNGQIVNFALDGMRSKTNETRIQKSAKNK
jgi:hypothetical protein